MSTALTTCHNQATKNMKYKCVNCGAINQIPDDHSPNGYCCYSCKSRLPEQPADGSTSAAVGLIGGAALGASIGGPVGAIVGGIIGALIGKESKGVG